MLILRLRRFDHITDAVVSLHCMVTSAGKDRGQGRSADLPGVA